LLRSGAADTETHIVHRAATCFVIVNLFPYTTGHVLVVPYREVADLDGLTAEETVDLWATVTDSVRVLRSVYAPDGMNVGLNLGRPAGGSVPDHLHVHVVPRWTGDSNFMSAISNTQTLPEALVDTDAKLRAGWAKDAARRQ
jgi:ATP adenylyltransferase